MAHQNSKCKLSNDKKKPFPPPLRYSVIDAAQKLSASLLTDLITGYQIVACCQKNGIQAETTHKINGWKKTFMYKSTVQNMSYIKYNPRKILVFCRFGVATDPRDCAWRGVRGYHIYVIGLIPEVCRYINFFKSILKIIRNFRFRKRNNTECRKIHSFR